MPESFRKPTCILLVGGETHLNACALAFANQAFDILATVPSQDQSWTEKKLNELQPDFVFSFLNDRILRGSLLEYRNVNFHPAPPEWPGRGGASFALYHDAEFYGATAHVMVRQVDAGDILAVKRFSIYSGESCESLNLRGKEACLILFYEILSYIREHRKLPDPIQENWKGRAVTRKQFEQWLILDYENKEEFIKKVKAAKHSQFPGPYVILHNYKFALVPNQ